MELRPGYKQTEVGVIPEDWSVVNIGEVSKTSSGTTPARSQRERYFRDGEFHWIKTMDLNNSLIEDTEEKVTALALKETCLQIYPIGTVLVAMYGGFNQIGRTGLLGIAASVNQALVAIQLERKKVEPRFLLNTLNYRVEYWKSVASSSRKDPNITSNDVKYFKFPLPPTKTEQTAIANALSDADALIQSLTRLIAKKRQIKQGAMQTLLNPYENGRLKAGWVVTRLGNILRVCHGKSQHEVADKNGKYPILATSGEIGRASKYLYDKPSVLIGRKGTIDVPRYMEYPFWSIDTLFYTEIFEPNNAKYLFYQFNLIDWYSFNEASGVPSLSARTIENIEISLPSPEKQVQIANLLSDMDAEIAALEAKLAKYRQIKQGMMQNLLTGRIRLI